ncbi:MAG: hypothetical protein M3348_00410, partial [Acidobacteriota bacterium]|nr:hypothetical protein [Acidobacteriota bacterium]
MLPALPARVWDSRLPRTPQMLTAEVERYAVTLRFTQPGRFHFNHGGALMGLLCRALATHELHAGVAPFASESGRVRFAPGEAYRFGLSLAGRASTGFRAEEFRAALARIGARPPDPNRPPPTLGGNFEVVSVEPCPPPAPADEIAKLAAARTVTLRLLSPLRVERPAPLKRKGAGYLNAECFPLSHFTRRLVKRLFLLARERFPEDGEIEDLLPSLGAAHEPVMTDVRLLWLDIPLEGPPGKRPAQGYTLGGGVGRVVFREVPESWLPHIVAGQDTHAGEKTHYGLGRYLVEECRAVGEDVFRPARTLYEELSDAARLETAFAHVVTHSTAAGVDSRAPSDCADEAEVT